MFNALGIKACMKTLTSQMQFQITPRKALNLLKEGNKRFVSNLRVNRNLLEQVNETSCEQHPFAVVLSCIDSRTSAELIFDQGLGDIFSIRIAGNILNEDILGSMEFSCKVAKAKIILVLGHTKCGAVKAACDGIKMGNLTPLLNKIQNAVSDEKSILKNRNSKNSEFVQRVSEINVKKTILDIMKRSSILNELIQNRKCGIVGGIHDITTGFVHFYEKDF